MNPASISRHFSNISGGWLRAYYLRFSPGHFVCPRATFAVWLCKTSFILGQTRLKGFQIPQHFPALRIISLCIFKYLKNCYQRNQSLPAVIFKFYSLYQTLLSLNLNASGIISLSFLFTIIAQFRVIFKQRPHCLLAFQIFSSFLDHPTTLYCD